MFPLGTVLFPGMPLPLQIFEPRYQEMLRTVLAGDGTFGVVLIERGHEVGGGDVRSDVGTRARIVRHQARSRGRHALIVVGVERIRVQQWLPDDPYPRAEVTAWPDEPTVRPTAGATPAPPGDPPYDPAGDYPACTAELRALLRTAGDLGVAVAPPEFEAPADPTAGSHILASLAPLGAFDRQRLLRAPTTESRLALLRTLLAEQQVLLRALADPESPT